MNSIPSSLRLLAMGTIGLALVGCAGKELMPKEMPAWVIKGSGAFKDGRKQVFYGVGAVTGIQNKPLERTAAENRARSEIAKVFETYTASLMRDYSASTTGGAAVDAESASSEEQHIEQTVKTFSSVTLSGVEIVDYWKDPSDGTLYSLARLDVAKFKDSVDTIKELNAQVRDFVRKNAEKAFNDLEKEEAKRGM